MTKKILAIDIGGSNIRFAKVSGKEISDFVIKKTPKNKKDLLACLLREIRKVSKKEKNIGISCAGLIKNGKVIKSPNLSLKNFDLQGFVEKNLKKRVRVENDARCAALAEMKFGIKKKNFIILILGTGIGGGIIVNGKLYKGKSNAGEFGHFILDNKKDFEKLYQNARGKEEKTIEVLGEGIASLISILNPEAIVLSGGLRENVGKNFLTKLKRRIRKYSFMEVLPEIKWSNFRNHGLIGAGLLFN
jgi:hypothetical protein